MHGQQNIKTRDTLAIILVYYTSHFSFNTTVNGTIYIKYLSALKWGKETPNSVALLTSTQRLSNSAQVKAAIC
jgi:hypothetical protein